MDIWSDGNTFQGTQEGVKGTIEGGNGPIEGVKWTQEGVKETQEGVKWTQEGGKGTQEGVQINVVITKIVVEKTEKHITRTILLASVD